MSQFPQFSIIVAMTKKDRVMGKDNDLPWKLPADLKFFKEKTLGQRIIMGRKTFESIGSRPLPKRENWVLSKAKGEDRDGLSFFQNKEDILNSLSQVADSSKKTFIIGGPALFELFWPEINELFITWIEADFAGDVFFPNLSLNSFECLEERREFDPFPHSFCHYLKKS
jgi:dihydrofolate reductase